MEHLTKQQIVLLTLLVSFITSLSTGIVTVSLMDQAPAVTHTVNQIIEKTITSPQSAAVGTVSITVDDQIAKAVSLVASSTVKIQRTNNGETVALGLIVSKNGLIMAAKNNIDANQSYEAIMANGTVISLTLNTLYQTANDSQTSSSVIFFAPVTNIVNGSPIIFMPVQTTTVRTLGQKVFSLAYAPDPAFVDGLISQVSSSTVATTITSSSKNIPGSPLFDIQGNILGIQTSQIEGQNKAEFNSIAPFLPAPSVL
ncbi:MAG: hypothetical protein V4524_03040 [Patescibacteria group bacterium]